MTDTYPTITERSGAQSATGLAIETTFGDPVSADTFLPMTSNTLEVDPGWFSPELMMNKRDLRVFNLYGEQKFTGSIEGPLFPSNAIQLLVAAIGTDAVTGTASPYTHTLSEALSLMSLTVEKNIGGYQSLQFAGCKVGKLTLKVAAGNEAASIQADVTGQSAAILDSPTAVNVTNELPFVFAEAAVSLFGHDRIEASSCEVSIDNGLKETYTFSGNRGPGFITPVTLAVSGTVDIVWSSLNDSTYGDYTTMITFDEGALSLALTHPAGSGAANAGFGTTIDLPQVVYSKYSNDLKISDVVMSSLSYEASLDISDGYTIQAAVTNGVSTAYAAAA